MDRILLVIAIVLLHSSPSLAADTGRATEGFQHTSIAYHEDGIDRAKPIARMSNYAQLTNINLTIQEQSSDDSLANGSNPGTSIGLGTAPWFGTYGVIRTNSNPNSTYVALGYVSDELTIDETNTFDSRDERNFSYGFGFNGSSSNFEYMMSVDEASYGVSAIGMRFTSAF